MQKLEIRQDDITEEKISALVSFLDSWKIPEWWTESKLATLYWRLKARWEKLDKAEEWLNPCYEKKKESYKWRILNEIKQWIEDMRNENWLAWHYQYEIANIKSRVDWRTMQLWFQDTDANDKVKRRRSVLIEEKENPEFFKEMLEKYAPKDLQPKPF
jgi:hypothetical protein